MRQQKEMVISRQRIIYESNWLYLRTNDAVNLITNGCISFSSKVLKINHFLIILIFIMHSKYEDRLYNDANWKICNKNRD